jgi:hypothetical protein
LTETPKEHFSFIQEDVKIGTSYVALLQELINEKPTGRLLDEQATNNVVRSSRGLTNEQMQVAMFRQIFIWLPIILGLVLLFTIFALIDMPIQKNSILYAKYGTTKQLQQSQ